MSDNPTPPHEVLYFPTEPEAVDALAQAVCARLGREYTQPDIVTGFAAYVRLAVDIQLRLENDESAQGNRIKSF